MQKILFIDSSCKMPKVKNYFLVNIPGEADYDDFQLINFYTS